jgi:hypothetical protein
MNQLPPKVLVKTWLFMTTRPDFEEAHCIAIDSIEQIFKTMVAAIKYAES